MNGRRRSVLVSGIGIAGPALAWWLVRSGFRVTLIERARAPRPGGQAVDFRGPLHRAILERMGIWEEVNARRTKPASLVMLDRRGGEAAVLPSFVIGGDVEIHRGALSELLYSRIADDVDARFGDSVACLEDRGGEVVVELESGAREAFDLVVGAEGLHSRIRGLAFGEGEHRITHQGYRIAGFSLANPLGLDGQTLLYSRPGRGVLVSESHCLFVFRGPPFGREPRDAAAARAEVGRVFGTDEWKVPALLAALDDAGDAYFDTIGTVETERYSNGRVALVGDAAWGGTLGGHGTPVALIGAHILAGALDTHAQDHEAAFAAYEARMRPFATTCQAGAKRAGRWFLAPHTALGIAMRNVSHAILASKPFLPWFERMVKSDANDFALPA